MAFAKSTPAGRPTQFGHVRWNIKNEEIPSPNLEFYDADTKTTSMLLQPGDKGGVQVTGKLVNATAFRREGFNDRKKGNGEENEWRLMLVLDSGEEELSAMTLDLISDTNVPNSNTLTLLNTIVKHLEDGGKDTPIQIGLYRNNKGYPASTVRLPSGFSEDGTPEFNDYKNFVRADDLPPRGEPVMVDGKHFEANGGKAYKYDNVLAWASDKMEALVSFFPKKDGEAQAEGAQAEQASNPDAGQDDGVELAEAIDQAANDAPAARERMTG